ncbi:hypothetical protein K3555_05040 [Leisingera sp. M527]|uniref:hypothetical protein n=1 Tax=Leisingera sp. M527 TaxID=2867014 RepID=UPI0021A39495|nr:hypothetical protein [Leisingera sp. M527]UWQ33874.1 hypothetical protein K3555_05040 [Leisingera sp. M527]
MSIKEEFFNETGCLASLQFFAARARSANFSASAQILVLRRGGDSGHSRIAQHFWMWEFAGRRTRTKPLPRQCYLWLVFRFAFGRVHFAN